MAIKTINISISENDLKKIDDYCTCHNLTRSKFLLSSAIEKVYVEEMANSLLLANQYLRNVAGKDAIQEEDREMIEKALNLMRGGLNE